MVADIGGVVGYFDDAQCTLFLYEGETGRQVGRLSDPYSRQHRELAREVAGAVGSRLPLTDCYVVAVPGCYRAHVMLTDGTDTVSVQVEESEERTAVLSAVLMALMDIRCR